MFCKFSKNKKRLAVFLALHYLLPPVSIMGFYNMYQEYKWIKIPHRNRLVASELEPKSRQLQITSCLCEVSTCVCSGHVCVCVVWAGAGVALFIPMLEFLCFLKEIIFIQGYPTEDGSSLEEEYDEGVFWPTGVMEQNSTPPAFRAEPCIQTRRHHHLGEAGRTEE